MLSVLLKIPAVIGIIILILLGIVLFLMLIVLFVPITYKIQCQVTESKKEASARVHWLFGIIRFTLHYSDQLSYKLKILWFDATGLIKRGSKESSDSNETSSADSNSSGNLSVSEDASDSGKANITEDVNNSNGQKISEDINDLKGPHTSDDSEASQEKKNSKTLEGDSHSKEESSGLTDKANKLLFKIKSIYAKIKDILNNISYYMNLLKEEDTKSLLSHCIKVVFNILKSIRPRKLKIDAEIGFDSPDTTGKVYGLLCMLYPYYGDDIHITPDFEKQILSGTIFCKGKIFICVLVINALRILFDRKLYKVIHKLKNGGKRNDR